MSVTEWATSAAAMILVARSSLPDGDGQAALFTAHENFVQRVLSMSASCGSISMALLGIYFLLAIDPRKLIFRHQLIFFLLFYDLMKAIVLLIYPARVISYRESYSNIKLCQAAGFFTAMAIEGADIAILAFAVHTYLLIFHPELTVRVKNSIIPRSEGGLYQYRYWVYGLSVVIPIVMASLAFIHPVGYLQYVCWCYLPQRPVWYRFVLSWVPRYVILVSIIAIYLFIYFHVIREFKQLGGVFRTMHRNNNTPDEKLSAVEKVKFRIQQLKQRVFPEMILPEASSGLENDRKKEHKDSEADTSSTSTPVHVDTQDIVYNKDFHQSNLENFRKRQKIIEKQMKSIFIYPFAYFLIWLFPFILQATQVNYEETHGPIKWLNGMGAFMQPIPGFVDTLVFFYREQPWKFTVMKTFESEHKSRMDSLVSTNQSGGPACNDNYSSAVLTKPSIPTDLIDDYEFSWWRRFASRIGLPFYALPDEKRASQIHERYMNDRVEVQPLPPLMTGPGGAHDFSAILGGMEDDFRKSQLDAFSMDFGSSTSTRDFSLPSSPHKNSVVSMSSSKKLAPNRRMSLAEVLESKSESNRSGSLAQVSPIANKSSADEMDLLDFLRKGP